MYDSHRARRGEEKLTALNTMRLREETRPPLQQTSQLAIQGASLDTKAPKLQANRNTPSASAANGSEAANVQAYEMLNHAYARRSRKCRCTTKCSSSPTLTGRKEQEGQVYIQVHTHVCTLTGTVSPQCTFTALRPQRRENVKLDTGFRARETAAVHANPLPNHAQPNGRCLVAGTKVQNTAKHD